jgi:DNA-binding LacI/PurR family transcriptional regulator
LLPGIILFLTNKIKKGIFLITNVKTGQKTTIIDVAKTAGVSVATVSRYLTKRGHVNAETSQIISNAIQITGYEHVRRKSVSNSQESKNVMIICGDISSQVYVQYIRGIQHSIGFLQYKVLIVDSQYNNKQEEEYLRYAIDQQFCGVVMLNVIESRAIVELIKSANIPIIFLNRYIKTLDVDIISMDNYRCGYIATQFLISAGHTRILHLGGPKNSISCRNRLHGYIDCMEDNHLSFDRKNLFYGDLQAQSGVDFAEFILKQNPSITAVYSANDIMAHGMVDALLAKNIRIPDDISVVCTDDTPAAVDGKVKLTCVSYDTFQMGVVTGELLLERIKNPSCSKKKIMYYPNLIERDSVKNLKQDP